MPHEEHSRFPVILHAEAQIRDVIGRQQQDESLLAAPVFLSHDPNEHSRVEKQKKGPIEIGPLNA